MDELEISGRRYISSVRAAKEHKYHADYIGQLVRGGKVVGQKVGRAWYVDADSLSEYLGKELPARGPVPRTIKYKSAEEPIKEEPAAASVVEDKENTEDIITEETEPEPTFVMPLRKSGRHHVIAAIETGPVKKTIKQNPEPQPAVEKQEEVFIEEFNSEAEAAEDIEEETFIPLKITKEIHEPEDSFYKVPSRSLRYVSKSAQLIPAQSNARRSEIRVPSNFGARLVRVAGVLVVAGTLSLGAGVLASYYLHSITTIANSGQSSSIILSQ
jgi:hypothetical protein